jgi:hypothetical protein
MFVGVGSELCGKNIVMHQYRRATGEGGVVEAFVSVNFTEWHVAMIVGGCVLLWNRTNERVVCECFDRFVPEVGSDCLPSSLTRLS